MTRSILSVINQKGGVGKTTSSLSLAASHGVLEKKVLLIDFDPQANSTSSIGIEINIGSKTIYDLSLLLGRRGTTNDNLIAENFVEIGLSINFDAIWFIKRKYD